MTLNSIQIDLQNQSKKSIPNNNKCDSTIKDNNNIFRDNPYSAEKPLESQQIILNNKESITFYKLITFRVKVNKSTFSKTLDKI